MKDATHQIDPSDINTSRHFFGAFGNHETEVSANWIVRFCQQRDNTWSPFTYAEIEKFYKFTGFTFNRLIKPESIVKYAVRDFSRRVERMRGASRIAGGDVNAASLIATVAEVSEPKPEMVEKGGGWICGSPDLYHITHDFVARCYKSAPMQVAEAR